MKTYTIVLCYMNDEIITCSNGNDTNATFDELKETIC